MKNKKIKSFFMTLVCTILILSVGYIGIVKSGKMMLRNEEEPQKVTFENTSSNIFYGKIEDDIQLFPWNYYGQNEITTGLEAIGFDPEGMRGLEDTFFSMEALQCDVEKDTIEKAYEKKGSGIIDNLHVSNTEYGLFFFYQDLLAVSGKTYQVKIAFSEYQVWSFSCIEQREEDVRSSERWEAGKKELTKMLDLYQDELSMCFYDIDNYYFEEFYDDMYLEAKNQVNDVFLEEYYAEEMDKMQELLQVSIENDEKVTLDWVEEQQEYDEEYGEYSIGEGEQSYQIIELNNVILLLMEKDFFYRGVYYDPISQEFCGYHVFW